MPVVAGRITFFLHPGLGRVERLVNIFDAAGLGLFCVTGALKALAFGLGAGIVVVAYSGGFYAPWVAVTAAVTCFVIRLFAVRRGWNAPRARA